MNWNKIGGGLVIGLIIACAVALTLMGTNAPAQSSTAMPSSKASLMIEVSNGRHGSIWKFVDDNRECYFNSSGGIWCTN
jgi:hypothetical protein